MRKLFLSALLMSCSSSPISQYCSSLASCEMENCELSPEACEELRQGEQNACEADLKSTRNVIATGGLPSCNDCVAAMDIYYQCAADIPTCSDFFDASAEDCDGEYQEYSEACTDEVQTECGQTLSARDDTSAENGTGGGFEYDPTQGSSTGTTSGT